MNKVYSAKETEILLSKHGGDYWKHWSQQDLDFYSQPINWTIEKDKKKVVQTHMKILTDETSLAKKTVPCRLDVPYGDDSNDAKKVDIYGTDLPPTAPTLFWVHGGRWEVGDRSWAAPMVRHFYQDSGIRTVIVGYPLAPKAKLEDMCTSIYEALSMTIQLFPSSVFTLAGHSAGGQLVVSLFHQIPGKGIPSLSPLEIQRVGGVCLLSAPYDLRPIFHLPSLKRILQFTSEDEAVNFSPRLNMDKFHIPPTHRPLVPFLLLVGESEPPTISIGGRLYKDALHKAHPDLKVDLQVVQGEDHFTIVNSLTNPSSQASTLLRNVVVLKNKSKL